MAAIAQPVILLVFFISLVQAGRFLKLNSSDDHLISDGLEYEDSSFKTNANDISLSIPSACDHQYGFLPCAENGAGYIFQILVYQALLIFGEKQIGSGSKVLFHIIGAGKFGGIIFRILMALPSMMLMIVSGIFSSTETAQSLVSVGVGIYTGITVFSLTIQWGACVIFGRRSDLKNKKSDETAAACFPAKEKLIILKDSGVVIDKETRYTAGIMLLSLIPYIFVQLVDVFDASSVKRVITLIALIVSTLSLLTYFAYQILDPWMQQRSLDYSRYEVVRKAFLQHVQRHGQLVDEDGNLNTQVITKLFSEADKDEDKCITKGEMKTLVQEIISTGKVKIDDKFAVSQVMQTFDIDDSSSITEKEFIKGCEKWIDETKRSSETSDSAASTSIFHELSKVFKEKKQDDPQEIARIMSKILKHAETNLLKSELLITEDGKPNIERIQKLFKEFDRDGDKAITTDELKQLISSVKFGEFQMKEEDVLKELFKDFDEDNNNIIDEPEFVEGVKKWLSKAVSDTNTREPAKIIDEFDKIMWKGAVLDKWALIQSVFQVSLGIFMLTFLGGPLMTSILELSFAMKFPSFIISFVVVPCAMNLRAALTALFPASQKNERTASLTFSEIYGGVIMNNMAGLTALLAIVYAKGLTWDFSAEVLTILVVCAIIGFLAYSSTTYPLWTCILAFALYPFSLGLFYFIQVFFSWN
ncbi:hypothetical protein ACS0TY_031417 [Phlomoides rotata]